MGVLVYNSNNSGGDWWLSDKDWKALERAGWTVHWVHDHDDPTHEHEDEEFDTPWPRKEHMHSHSSDHYLTKVKWNGNRYLDALARSAAVETDDPAASVREWEEATGQDAGDIGCNCCGRPHSFKFIEGENVRYMEVDEPSSAPWRI